MHGSMSQPILHTPRLLLVPLADRHLELEVELDSDPEVLRYLSGRAHTRSEVVAKQCGARSDRIRRSPSVERRDIDGDYRWGITTQQPAPGLNGAGLLRNRARTARRKGVRHQ